MKSGNLEEIAHKKKDLHGGKDKKKDLHHYF